MATIVEDQGRVPNLKGQLRIAAALERIADAQTYNSKALDALIPTLLDGTVDTYNKVQRTWFLLNGAETADAATLTSLVDKWYNITRPDWDGYVEFYNPDVSSVSTGTKRGDLAGMVCEPSTTTVAGRDDFAGNPLFAVTTVNWVMNGTEPQITAIKGITSNYEQDNPAKYVGVVQMSGYHYWTDPTEQKTDAYMEGYCSKYKNKYSHIEPLPESIRVDKTIRPWVIHAKYLGGVDSDGKATCCSGQVIKDQVSHNNWQATVKNNGPTYSGWCTCDLAFLKLMTHIEFASLTLDDIMNGCFAYYYQDYVALAESDTNRVLIASTGHDYVVGSRIFIGANKQSDGNMDMTQTANTYSLSGRDGRIVTSVQTVTIDNTTYKAIYFSGSPITTYINDSSTGFTVAIHTAWWNTGSTDGVLGNTGSIDNKDQRYPIMLQGIEFECGQYEIPTDCIVKYWQDTSDTSKYYYAPYIVNTVANQSTDITSNYIDLGIHVQCPTNNEEPYIKYEKYKNGVYFPYLVGGSSSTYTRDAVWRYGARKYTGSIELLCFGSCYWNATPFGLSRLLLGDGLGGTWWYHCSRLSPNGNRGCWG